MKPFISTKPCKYLKPKIEKEQLEQNPSDIKGVLKLLIDEKESG